MSANPPSDGLDPPPRVPGDVARRGTDGRGVGAAVLAVPVALSLALGAFQLTDPSLWLDEGASVAIASQHGAALGAAMARDGGNMLGYYALLHVLIGWFGDSAVVLRLPSVLGAAATTGLVALFARRFFSERCALAAALLTAVSLPLVYFAQNARSYALMTACVVASVFATAVLADRGDRPHRLALAAFVVATVVACYLSFVAALVVPAEAVAVFYWRRWSAATRDWLVGVVVAGACCAPLAVLASRRGAGQLFWVPSPGATVASDVAHALASSALTPNFHRVATSAVLLGATGAAICVAAVSVATGIRRVRVADAESQPGARRRAAVSLLALSWLVVPVVLELIESLVSQPILLPRNVMVSLPAVALLLALACTETFSARRRGIAFAGCAVAGFLVLRGLSLFATYGTSPENWRAATAAVARASRPGDCVVFYPEDGRMPFDYYLRSSAAAARLRPVLPATPWRTVSPFVEDYRVLSTSAARLVTSSCSRVWLVASHQGSTSGTATALAHAGGYRAVFTALAAVYRDNASRAFGYAAPIDVTVFSVRAPTG